MHLSTHVVVSWNCWNYLRRIANSDNALSMNLDARFINPRCWSEATNTLKKFADVYENGCDFWNLVWCRAMLRSPDPVHKSTHALKMNIFFRKIVKITLVFYCKSEHAMRCNKFGTDDKSTHRMPTKKKFADVYEREREFSKPWKNAMTSLKTFESLDTCTEETQKSVWSQISTASGIRKNLTRET